MVGQAMVEKHALNIFNKADMEDREGKFTKFVVDFLNYDICCFMMYDILKLLIRNLVKQFYSSGLLFDSLNYFGDLSEDVRIICMN